MPSGPMNWVPRVHHNQAWDSFYYSYATISAILSILLLAVIGLVGWAWIYVWRTVTRHWVWFTVVVTLLLIHQVR
jgi:hypothetical protein